MFLSGDIRIASKIIHFILLDHNCGFAVANNLAARQAGEVQWLALLNPDAFPEPGW